MSQNLFIIAFLVLCPFYGSGQLAIDYDCQTEVSEIILNFKQFGIDKFGIKYRQQFNRQRPTKDLFKYHFLSDSLLKHTYKTSRSFYKFEAGSFVPLLDRRDSLWYANSKKDKLFVTTDSAGIKTNYTYLITKQDTMLIAAYSSQVDGETETRTSKYLQDSVWHIQKITTTNLSDSSKRVQSSVFKDNQWYRLFVYEEVTSRNNDQNSVTVTGTSYAGGHENSERIIGEINLTRKAIYYHNAHGLIEKIEIIETTKSTLETTTLIPVKRK